LKHEGGRILNGKGGSLEKGPTSRREWMLWRRILGNPKGGKDTHQLRASKLEMGGIESS